MSVPARKATKDSPESSNKQKVETPTRVYLGPPKNGGKSAVEGSNSSTTTKGGVAPTSPTTAAKPAVSTTAAPTTTTQKSGAGTTTKTVSPPIGPRAGAGVTTAVSNKSEPIGGRDAIVFPEVAKEDKRFEQTRPPVVDDGLASEFDLRDVDFGEKLSLAPSPPNNVKSRAASSFAASQADTVRYFRYSPYSAYSTYNSG